MRAGQKAEERGDTGRALEDLQWVWKEARRDGETPSLQLEELFETRVSVARLLRRAGRFEDAEAALVETREFLSNRQGDNPKLSMALRRAGLETARALIQAGKNDRAAELLADVLQGLEGQNPESLRLAAQANKWQAWIEHQEKRYEEALRIYRQGISLVEDFEPSLELASLLDGMAMCLSRDERFEEAERALNQARECAHTVGNRESEAGILTNLGVLRYRQRRYDEALGHFREARSLNEAIGNPVVAAICRSNIGDVLLKQGKAEEARNELEGALGVFRRTSSQDYRIAALQSLLNCLEELGDRQAQDQLRAELRVITGEK
jgi:tetratricopeptide (TPR) repeat protein